MRALAVGRVVHPQPSPFYPGFVTFSSELCFSTLSRHWSPRQQTSFKEMVDTWRSVLPRWVLDNVMDQLVFPKIRCVCVWVGVCA